MPTRSLRRTKGKSKSKSKKQRLYNMRGCSKTKSKRSRSQTLAGGNACGSACPIAPFSWNQMQQRGGTFYKASADMPGPFVGQSWTPSIKGWSGVDGVSNNHNYLANNLYNNGDPQTMMKLGGSRKGKRGKRGKKYKGGAGLIPQDLVNLGRDASFNFQSAYNALNGYSAPSNPLPYRDQLSSSISANRIIM